MDTVPLNFVDAVVELFGKRILKPLAESVNNTVFKDIIDLHFCTDRMGLNRSMWCKKWINAFSVSHQSLIVLPLLSLTTS
ncbi:hypothetical protein QR680_007538 [Steinernema hermaphroditum]|uniref:Uncharacterized protein n=1 Tax=Steinernema hermaphroditum TaxID=289476 RepID=A0AA39IFN4_9BILA|nr:hypothetical protein QR680_007538 [Steinernema hermaphroditum]